MGKQTPLIRYDSLAGEWIALTRYTNKGTHIMAHTGYRHNVTDQIEAIITPTVKQRDALLEVCKEAWVFCGDDARTPHEFEQMYERLKAAIIKAEGGTRENHRQP
jgi:hypothetical protein